MRIRTEHRHSKLSHDAHRHVDVRLGNQLARDFNIDRFRSTRSSHQQRTEILAGDISRQRRLAAGQSLSLHADGWAIRSEFTFDVDTELRQRLNEMRDRPLPHALVAVEPVLAVAERTERRQESNARPAVFQPEVGFLGRRFPAAAGDFHRAVFDVVRDGNAQTIQAFHHDARVITGENPGQLRRS